jgi:hypothetical protein
VVVCVCSCLHVHVHEHVRTSNQTLGLDFKVPRSFRSAANPWLALPLYPLKCCPPRPFQPFRPAVFVAHVHGDVLVRMCVCVRGQRELASVVDALQSVFGGRGDVANAAKQLATRIPKSHRPMPGSGPRMHPLANPEGLHVSLPASWREVLASRQAATGVCASGGAAVTVDVGGGSGGASGAGAGAGAGAGTGAGAGAGAVRSSGAGGKGRGRSVAAPPLPPTTLYFRVRGLQVRDPYRDLARPTPSSGRLL